MNFLGHHEVARQVEPDDRLLLFGSMLPDFAGMFGARKLYKSKPVADRHLREGLRLHGITNSAFDENPAMVELESSLIDAMKSFLPKWSAVQGGRVGKDILFDGLFFQDLVALSSYSDTMRLAARGNIDLTGVVEPTDIFEQGVRELETRGLSRYDDASVVALRLQRRLSGTRTSIDENAIDSLTTVFADHQPTVFALGGKVLAEVIQVTKRS